MKHLIILFFASIISTPNIFGQGLKAYQIYDKNQNPVDFQKMIDELSKYDVVLFGEYHDNSIIHWLELKTTEALYKLKGDQLILGAEMFERDNQEVLNQYLSGVIDAKKLADSARLWNNFKTDYKPLLDFAKENKLNFIATNVPRRYASIVSKFGIDSLNRLSDNEKKFIAKLPITIDMQTPGYVEMQNMMKEHAGGREMDFVAAQATKDATMAESILDNFKRKQLFLHYNGDYHSKEYGGIYWHLKNAKKRLKVAVISIYQSETDDLQLPKEFVNTEFIIAVPGDMTRTY